MSILYSLLLVGVTVAWGWTFVVVQDAIALYGILGFLAVRFALAASALAPVTSVGVLQATRGFGGASSRSQSHRRATRRLEIVSEPQVVRTLVSGGSFVIERKAWLDGTAKLFAIFVCRGLK